MVRPLALCAIATVLVACGGSQHASARVRIAGEGGIGPVLTLSDVEPGSAHVDIDQNGAPVVVLRFTKRGAARFTRLTHALVREGRRRGRPLHVVVSVDGRVVTRPYIDFNLFPNGLSGQTGLEITGLPSRAAAVHLAKKLRG